MALQSPAMNDRLIKIEKQYPVRKKNPSNT